jgi:hypothetical protein
MRIFVCALPLLVATEPISAQSPTRVYDAVVRGMECKQQQTGMLECNYRVGKSLHFAIAGVGGPEAGVTFFKVDWDGDYYATFGVQHGCVVVKEGQQSLNRLPKDGAALPEMAFVSPRTGKVYRTWPACFQAK